MPYICFSMFSIKGSLPVPTFFPVCSLKLVQLRYSTDFYLLNSLFSQFVIGGPVMILEKHSP